MLHKPKFSSRFVHDLYQRLRPYFDDWGVLNLMRRVLPERSRWALADRLGLASFQVLGATGRRLPLARARTLAGPRRVRRVDGLNLVGDLRADVGLSEVTRQTLRALRAVGLGATYNEIIVGPPSRTQPLAEPLPSGAPYDVSLFDVFFYQFYDRVKGRPPSLDGKYSIAAWSWELPKFPRLSPGTLLMVDEVWVISTYVQKAIAARVEVPVTIIPPAVEVSASRPDPRSAFDLPADRFVFLFSFNAASGVVRKNPFAVIEAFRRAFGKSEAGPLLVLKAQHLDSLQDNGRFGRDLQSALQSVDSRLLDDNLTRQQMIDLLAACDSYVSLHHSEGFGLGMAEAMALGKPVIGTGYSGNLDFMNASNSWLVRHTPRTITMADHHYQPHFATVYVPGQVWVEPDVDHAAELMQQVMADPARAREVGAIAARDIRREYSVQAVGQRICDRLQAIAATVR